MDHVFRSYFGHLRWWLVTCALVAVQVAHGAALEPGQFRSSPSGTLVWEPTTEVGKRLVGQGVWNQAVGGGVAVSETGTAALRGAQITMTANRALSAAAVGRGAISLFGGPFGVALALAPSIIDWIDKDNQKKVRLNPDRSGFQMRGEVPDYPKSNGYEYRGGHTQLAWRNNPITACIEDLALGAAESGNTQTFIEMEFYGSDGGYAECRFSFAPSGRPDQVSIRTFQLGTRNASGCPKGWYITPNGCIQNPGEAEWLPATMSDISPYLYPYPVPVALAKEVAAAGVNMVGTMAGITGPASVGDTAPKTDSQPVNTPPDQESSRTRSGNPFSLAPNSPTVTSSTSGSTPISVGGNTVNAPTHTTTTSTYNPTTNSTSSTTTTKADPLTQNTTTNTTTNITYTTNNATSTTTTTTTTNIINNVTNTIIYTNKTDTPLPPGPDPAEPTEPTPDLCATNPEILACAKLGEPPTADTLNKTNKAFEMTAATFASAQGCPAPVTFSLSLAGVAGSYTIPYTPACDVMQMLRGLILAIAAFAAAYILADSFKVT